MSDHNAHFGAWLDDFTPGEIALAVSPLASDTGASGFSTPHVPNWSATPPSGDTISHLYGADNVPQSIQSHQLAPYTNQSSQSLPLRIPQGTAGIPNTDSNAHSNQSLTPTNSTGPFAAIPNAPGQMRDLPRTISSDQHHLQIPHGPGFVSKTRLLQPRPASNLTPAYSQLGDLTKAHTPTQSSSVSPFLNGLGISAASIENRDGDQFMVVNMTRIDQFDPRLKSLGETEVPTLALRMKRIFSAPSDDTNTLETFGPPVKWNSAAINCANSADSMIVGSDAAKFGAEILRYAAMSYNYRLTSVRKFTLDYTPLREGTCPWESIDAATRRFQATLLPFLESQLGDVTCRAVTPKQWRMLNNRILRFSPTGESKHAGKDQEYMERLRTHIEKEITQGKTGDSLREPHSCRLVYEQPDGTLSLLTPGSPDLASKGDTKTASGPAIVTRPSSSLGRRKRDTTDGVEGVVRRPSRSPFRDRPQTPLSSDGVSTEHTLHSGTIEPDMCSEAQTDLRGTGLGGQCHMASQGSHPESHIQPWSLSSNQYRFRPTVNSTEAEEADTEFNAATLSATCNVDEDRGCVYVEDPLQAEGELGGEDLTLEEIESLLAGVQ